MQNVDRAILTDAGEEINTSIVSSLKESRCGALYCAISLRSLSK